MIDPKLLRADIAYVANKLKIKGFDLDIGLFLKLEKNRKTLQSDYESIASERNANAKAIGKTIAAFVLQLLRVSITVRKQFGVSAYSAHMQPADSD